jgi:hypothetical protein
MRVKLTHPINDPVPLQAGQVLEVSSTLAKIWIENDWAFEIVEEQSEPVKPKYKKEVKDGDG